MSAAGLKAALFFYKMHTSMTNNVYFAPMEGITLYPFRNLFHTSFGGVSKYFTPFVSANHTFAFQEKEILDIAPENQAVPHLVPQILTNDAKQCLFAIQEMQKRGYQEVNLNFGCPSGTVTAKGKGAGMLRDLHSMDAFLSEVFSSDLANLMRISVKTRLGYDTTEQCEDLMRIYGQYPIYELIIHARVRKAMYRGMADKEAFARMYALRKAPLIYNGDVSTSEDLLAVGREFPGISGVMIGRGLLRDPAMLTDHALTIGEWRRFHDQLFAAYKVRYQSDRIAMARMKELWYYWNLREGVPTKRIRDLLKETDAQGYQSLANIFFQTLDK